MQKKLGLALIILGILAMGFIVSQRIKEIKDINLIIARNDGSCYLEDGTCLHDTHSVWPYVLAGTIAFLIICIGVYLLIIGDAEKKILLPKKKIIMSDEEKKVYDTVVGSDGTIFQSELVEKTGMSKVKVTRILDKLEGKGAIERKRRGMTNVVILKN